jgi:hypothetical protein
MQKLQTRKGGLDEKKLEAKLGDLTRYRKPDTTFIVLRIEARARRPKSPSRPSFAFPELVAAADQVCVRPRHMVGKGQGHRQPATGDRARPLPPAIRAGAASARPRQPAIRARPLQPAHGARPLQPAIRARPRQPAIRARPLQPAIRARPLQPAIRARPLPPAHGARPQGAASATGYQGAASATGDQGAASATGDQGAASATGDQGAASATGYQGAASATGDRGAASAPAIRARPRQPAKLRQLWPPEYGRASGIDGSALFLVERISDWLRRSRQDHRRLGRHRRPDGIKPDTFYTLRDGKPVEVA